MNCVFFDRDGVVNRSPGGSGYVTTWEEFHFSDGIFDAFRAVHAAGFSAVLVTSQQGVAKGLMTEDALALIHTRMQERLLEETGDAFLDIQYCPHLEGTCHCRKPSPEMIHRATEKLGIDLSHSWLVGDHDRDIEMAHHAGIPASRTVRIRGDHGITYPAAFTLDRVADLAPLLRRELAG